jgi:hypothetical protein
MAAVAGCAHLSLKDKAVREIRVQTVAEPGLCNGQEGRIAVIAVMSDGSELATTGAGKGRVGQLPGGVSGCLDTAVTLSSDPRHLVRPAALVVAADHAGVEWRGEVPVRCDCDVDADF